MNSQRRTLEQERAGHAWAAVQRAGSKDFGSTARDLPAMLQVNGLGQTLAFLRSKGHHDLLDGISSWVVPRVGASEDLLKWIIEDASAVEYRRAASEAMAIAEWLKRFAEADAKGEVGGAGSPGAER